MMWFLCFLPCCVQFPSSRSPFLLFYYLSPRYPVSFVVGHVTFWCAWVCFFLVFRVFPCVLLSAPFSFSFPFLLGLLFLPVFLFPTSSVGVIFWFLGVVSLFPGVMKVDLWHALLVVPTVVGNQFSLSRTIMNTNNRSFESILCTSMTWPNLFHVLFSNCKTGETDSVTSAQSGARSVIGRWEEPPYGYSAGIDLT